MSGTERLRSVALGTTTMAALAGAGLSAYLWARAFTGGAELVVRPPSVDAVRQEVVPALIAAAEPRREAHRPAVRATRVVQVGVVPEPSSAVQAPRAIPISRPTSPKPTPTPPESNPGATPPPAPSPAPAPQPAPSPPASPAAPPAAPPGPAPTPGGQGGSGTPAAVPTAPQTPQPSPQQPQNDDRNKGKGRKEHERATPAQPAVPPRPQEQKPPPAATPAVPAVPPAQAGSGDDSCDDRGERNDDRPGKGKRP